MARSTIATDLNSGGIRGGAIFTATKFGCRQPIEGMLEAGVGTGASIFFAQEEDRKRAGQTPYSNHKDIFS
jgi:hypothetical protein